MSKKNVPTRILVVDDEPDICAIVKRYFEREGFEVHTAADGEEMRRVMNGTSVDLVILDVRLPGDDGFSLAAELRTSTKVAIVMLTEKSDLVDRVAGLESGADDYVPKPFDLRELLARTRAVLRRTRLQQDDRKQTDGYFFSGWHLNLATRQLSNPDAAEVELSPAELDLLITLVQNPNRVLSRDFLLTETRGRPAAPFDRTIDVRIGQIRKKLESNPAQPTVIKTVRNAGYIFTPDVTRDKTS